MRSARFKAAKARLLDIIFLTLANCDVKSQKERQQRVTGAAWEKTGLRNEPHHSPSSGPDKKNLKSWIDCGVNTIYYQRGLRSAFSWSLICPPQDWCPHLRWSRNGLIQSKDAILASLLQGRFLGSSTSWFFLPFSAFSVTTSPSIFTAAKAMRFAHTSYTPWWVPLAVQVCTTSNTGFGILWADRKAENQ